MQRSKEQILKAYELKSNEILKKMMRVLMRAQRKVDDEAYRKTLEKFEKHP
jgi:hypothetical protein